MLEECIKMFVVIGFLLWISLDSLHSVSLSSFYTAFSEQEPHEIRVKENDWNGNGKEKRRKKTLFYSFLLVSFSFCSLFFSNVSVEGIECFTLWNQLFFTDDWDPALCVVYATLCVYLVPFLKDSLWIFDLLSFFFVCLVFQTIGKEVNRDFYFFFTQVILFVWTFTGFSSLDLFDCLWLSFSYKEEQDEEEEQEEGNQLKCLCEGNDGWVEFFAYFFLLHFFFFREGRDLLPNFVYLHKRDIHAHPSDDTTRQRDGDEETRMWTRILFQRKEGDVCREREMCFSLLEKTKRTWKESEEPHRLTYKTHVQEIRVCFQRLDSPSSFGSRGCPSSSCSICLGCDTRNRRQRVVKI